MWAWLLSLLGVLAWRAGWLCGPAPGEIRSLLLSRQRPPAAVVNAPLVDQFPVGYPLALGHWERLGRALGVPAGLPWSRLPGVLAWAGLLAAAGLAGRVVAGPGAGAVLVMALAACGQGLFAARRLDGAALAGPAVGAGLLTLLALYRLERTGRIGFSKSTLLWVFYALAGAVAVGGDRLAAPALAGLFALWLALCARHRMWRTRLIEGGAWAHLFIALIAIPFFLTTPHDDRAMAGLAQPWLAAAGRWESLRRLILGHSTGQHAWLIAPLPWAGWLTSAAVAAALAPGLFLMRRLLFWRGCAVGAHERGASLLALGGLFVALAGFVLTRALQATRWGRFYVWPADGFPAWPAFAAGLAGLALWAGRRCGASSVRVWLALAPWLAAGLLGLAFDLRHELRQAASDRALAGKHLFTAPVYAMPAEMIPYLNNSLGAAEAFADARATALGGALQPLSALGEGSPAATNATSTTLVNLNPWPLLDAPRDTLAAALAGAGQLSKSVRKTALPVGPGLELFTFSGLDRERAARLAAGALSFQDLPVTSGTIMQVRPQDLLPGDGWGELEAGPRADAWRWSRRGQVRFRLPGLLPEGDYVVHLKGMRLPGPKGPQRWTLRFKWDYQVYTVEVPEGWFEVAVPVRLDHIYRRCYLDLDHPTASPAAMDPSSTDTRQLGFLFLKLWVTRESNSD